MISIKYASIVAVAAFAAGSFFASPLPEAIASTIANDVICSGCVGTSDLAGNAVTAAKIKDSEVKAAEIAANAVGASEIAANAVGASELQGVSKLMFGTCTRSLNSAAGSATIHDCQFLGAEAGDKVIATPDLGPTGNGCLKLFGADVVEGGFVRLGVRNDCSSTVMEERTFNIILFRK